MTRAGFLASVSACAIVFSHAAMAQTVVLRPRLVANGLANPLDVTHAPGDASRLFIVEQRGKIKVVDVSPTGTFTVRSTPLIDLAAQLGPSTLEYGVLGLAFHPQFATNGYFFVVITPPKQGSTSNADYAVVRLKISANDPNVADPASLTTIFRIGYQDVNHRSGWIAFGPDGYLYFTTGDGGENDPRNAAADKTNIRGKLLRIDVDGPDHIIGTADDDAFPADPLRNYAIPQSNPFVSEPTTQPEIWAYGLRNMWRGGFDRQTGDLWLADVGQVQREEIDFQPASSAGGTFYGWRCKEGTLTSTFAECAGSLPPSTPPVFEYPHSGGAITGSAVVGGYVYRGCAIPQLRGTYFFADWTSKIWTATPSGGTLTNVVSRAGELTPAGASSLGTVVSFGEDAQGEMYYVKWNSTDGAVYKIEAASPVAPDCNGNGRSDACDIALGFSLDVNSNGVPDECEHCAADFNSVGGITVQDIFDFLGAWFAGATSADFNAVGGVTVQDVFDYLAAWFVGCP